VGLEMMRFEDLEVWKRAARLSSDLYKQLMDLKDYGFRDQITRSGLSIPSNTAEGFERESQKDCIKFLTYAKGSCGELRCQIYIGMDIDYIPKDIGKKWIQETVELSSMLSGLIKTKRGFLKNSLTSIIALII
jgi:four helix bundle protein